MKAVFVGGGASRLVGILREAFSYPGLFSGGEINLYDLNAPRARAVARMLQKTPEYGRVGCRITSGTTLEAALEGADMVGVILMAGSQKSYQLGALASRERGFFASDNLSPNGAFLAIKGGPILLNLARKMERYCPGAWLVDFANAVAVHSGMINQHSKIQALGVCAGYTNHEWDLNRILTGKDEPGRDFDVEAAGVNHLSFITKGAFRGRDLFVALDRRLAGKWEMPPLQAHLPPGVRKSITRSVTSLVRFYRALGVLIFSTEGDGMAHLAYDEWCQRAGREAGASSPGQVQAQVKQAARNRAESDRKFQALLETDLNQTFWDRGWQVPANSWARKTQHDIFVEILRGRAGETVKIVASRPNRGAVEGFPDRTVLEYSMIIEKGAIRPAGGYRVPEIVHGLVSGLAMHQTMLGDAIATDDPKLLAHALLAYPMRQFSVEARRLYQALARINRDEMPRGLRSVGDYL